MEMELDRDFCVVTGHILAHAKQVQAFLMLNFGAYRELDGDRDECIGNFVYKIGETFCSKCNAEQKAYIESLDDTEVKDFPCDSPFHNDTCCYRCENTGVVPSTERGRFLTQLQYGEELNGAWINPEGKTFHQENIKFYEFESKWVVYFPERKVA